MSADPDVVPVTVAIPTIGRLEPIRRCLESLRACVPAPAEILVVDQSHDSELAELVADMVGDRARVVPSHGLGVARARNDGLRAAAHPVVLVTDDDCTVPVEWVGTGHRLTAAHPGAIVTGRVLPVGDPRAVPSTKDDPVPADLSSERRGGWLFGNNMALPRDSVLDLGGFDERFGPEEAAEDNEFCYRWLRAGRPLRYEPSLAVEHHDWRSPDELERLYVRYARGEGYFYGIELVKDKETRETFDEDESERLLRGFLSKALFEAGLYCRADDRGDPVIQLSPPLICDQTHFDEIEQILRVVLDKASTLL